MQDTPKTTWWARTKNTISRLKELNYSHTEKTFAWYFFAWLVIFICGTVVHYVMYSAYPVNNNHHVTEKLVRSAASSFNLFFLNIDSNCVDGWLEYTKVSAWGILFGIVAILAGLWTIGLVGMLVWTLLRRWRQKIKSLLKENTNLYIFVGINTRSKQVAEDILKDSPDDSVCLFLVPPADEELENTSIWDRLFRAVYYKHNLYQDVVNLDAQILIAEKKIVECESRVGNEIDVWEEIGLPLMKNYIKNSKQIHILLLGENETENIYDALRLSEDTLLKARSEQEVTIHCHARRGNVNRITEDLSDKSMIEVIDSSHMAIELLKQDVQNHPISFVKLSDKDPGTVASAFRALIIGFSECGQDALRFLYEFSALVDESAGEDEDTRSPFYCDIVDKRMNISAARWKNMAPGVFEKNNTKGKKEITFHLMDYGSEAFYTDVLKPIIKELNYVVIAVGNDRAGITLAADIFRYALRMGRIDLAANSEKSPFRIYVRSYDPSMLDFMKQVAAHLNGDAHYVEVFGSEKEIYTMQVLLNNELKEQAMEYYYRYKQVEYANFGGDEEPKESKEEQWQARRSEAFQPGSKSQIKNNGKYGATLNLRREESQDYANTRHQYTKAFLKQHGASIHRIAQTEHLRWWAAHELMGFEPEVPECTSKNIVRYCHPSMVSWSQLDGPTRAYDYMTLHPIYESEILDKTIQEVRESE